MPFHPLSCATDIYQKGHTYIYHHQRHCQGPQSLLHCPGSVAVLADHPCPGLGFCFSPCCPGKLAGSRPPAVTAALHWLPGGVLALTEPGSCSSTLVHTGHLLNVSSTLNSGHSCSRATFSCRPRLVACTMRDGPVPIGYSLSLWTMAEAIGEAVEATFVSSTPSCLGTQYRAEPLVSGSSPVPVLCGAAPPQGAVLRCTPHSGKQLLSAAVRIPRELTVKEEGRLLTAAWASTWCLC